MTTMTPPPLQRPPEGDGADALIKEARDRQRRRRLRFTGFFLVFASLVGLSVNHWSPGGRHPSSGDPPAPAAAAAQQRRLEHAASTTTIGAAGLVSPSVGWAMNGSALWLTTDAGKTWRVITPAQLRKQDVIARVADVFFTDRTHGWVSAEVAGQGGAFVSAMLRTSDGGRTWTRSTLPGCSACADVHLSFIGPKVGYASASDGSNGFFYDTIDGGLRWRLVAHQTVFGEIAFGGAGSGWLITDGSSSHGGGDLYRSADGGASWNRVTLTAPNSGATRRPLFVTSVQIFNHGVVVSALALDSHSRRLRPYVATTANTKWTIVAAPTESEQHAGQGGVPTTSFSASSMDSWTLFDRGRPVLLKTDDAGRSWHRTNLVPKPVPPTVWDPDFPTATRGWAIFPAGTFGDALVATTDGGRRWTPLAPPPIKQQRVPRPTAPCGSSCERP